MGGYVDGFVIPLSKAKVGAYRRLARVASRVWLEHGALGYFECVGDDLKPGVGRPFPKVAGCKAGETVVFAWIVYASRAARDRVNKKVMADPRLAKAVEGLPSGMPIDCQRMSFGGFKVLVRGER
jgi:uncharacterized protein YbaA (DUF1428 family)